MVTLPEFFDKAKEFVTGDRQETHGDPGETHARVAILWNAYLTARREPGSELAGRDVAAMMALLKLARTEGGTFNPDNFVDAIGYLAIMGELDKPQTPPA